MGFWWYLSAGWKDPYFNRSLLNKAPPQKGRCFDCSFYCFAMATIWLEVEMWGEMHYWHLTLNLQMVYIGHRKRESLLGPGQLSIWDDLWYHNTHTYPYPHTHIYIHIYIHTYIYIHIHIYIHIYIYIYIIYPLFGVNFHLCSLVIPCWWKKTISMFSVSSMFWLIRFQSKFPIPRQSIATIFYG